MKTAQKGFEKTGIWPTNEGIFTDDDFLPAETTNIPIAETEIAPTQVTQVDDFPENNSFNDPSTPPPRELKETSNETQNGSLPWMSDTPIAPIKKVITSSYPAVSPEAFIPVPKLTTTVKRVQRKRSKTTIITESPYKAELTEALEKSKKNKVKKNLSGQKQKRETEKMSRPKKQKIIEARVSSEEEEGEDTLCLFCNDQYSTSTEV
ncbi:unnamed protein product [Acanthoscelides obtectus]|uniref:Uncharacterized protein n=2 Tax=Acanthoscelides obtectus TaxID=200917 RepID=A0A9P0NVW7_ACAOB|nr:unnamed protein product [Acanthoscelides obtectus]CAK1665731.1 hypothetical protein AOBTE_LOCUS24940 [Acanthoscelides obtectus]